MKAQATAKNIRISPRKVRLVIDLIRGQNVVRAFALLNTLRNRAVEPVTKVLQSAVANADKKEPGADVDKYKIIKPFLEVSYSIMTL